MKTGFQTAFSVIVASGLFCVSKPSKILADALDVWHTNATFNATGIAYGDGKFVAVAGTSLQVSTDGVVWTEYISPPVLSYAGIVFGGGTFMAWGSPISTNNSGPHHILRSFDGLNWTKVYEASGQIKGGVFGNGRFVFVGDSFISTSLNPLAWLEFQSPNPLGGVCFGNGRFVAVSTASSAYVISSSDAIVWRKDYSEPSYTLRGIGYGNGLFVANWRTSVGDIGGFLLSSNLVSWELVTLGSGLPNTAMGANFGFANPYFIGSIRNQTFTTTNGTTWVVRHGADGASVFASGKGTFLASGGSETRQSDVFYQETNSLPPTYLAIDTYPGVTIQGSEGQTYRIEYATNFSTNATWLAITNVSLPSSNYFWVDRTPARTGRRFYRAILVE